MRLPAGAEWIIILLIVLLLFGASRLPGLAQSVGRSMRLFRSEVKDKDARAPGTASTDAPADDASGSTTSPTSDDDGGRTHP